MHVARQRLWLLWLLRVLEPRLTEQPFCVLALLLEGGRGSRGNLSGMADLSQSWVPPSDRVMNCPQGGPCGHMAKGMGVLCYGGES